MDTLITVLCVLLCLFGLYNFSLAILELTRRRRRV